MLSRNTEDRGRVAKRTGARSGAESLSICTTNPSNGKLNDDLSFVRFICCLLGVPEAGPVGDWLGSSSLTHPYDCRLHLSLFSFFCLPPPDVARCLPALMGARALSRAPGRATRLVATYWHTRRSGKLASFIKWKRTVPASRCCRVGSGG